MKLFVAPKLEKHQAGGVASVITAHERELRKLGVEFVNKEEEADLIIAHALTSTGRSPDVFHSHGFYPTSQDGWGKMFHNANLHIIDTMLASRAVVAVSELAAEVMRRDFHVNPRVIRNGVNFHGISNGGNSSGPVLWPKTSINPNNDPTDLIWLAKNRKDLQYASILSLGHGIIATGILSHSRFLDLLRNCSIYLGITRENNSMATMEAMAMGIPVVGYSFGFNREWLQSGLGCELVDPGDLEGLSLALDKVRANWWNYHKDAKTFARSNFGWDKPIQELYDLYKSLLNNGSNGDSVSVVIPLHNYARWIGEAVQSAKDQTKQPLEIIVVDDASTDNPIIPDGVKLIRLRDNVGVARARNYGIEVAKGNLILCLDADDRLAKDYIERAVKRFKYPRAGIVYGALNLTDENGKLLGRKWFNVPYSFQEQSLGHNKIPTCCVFRKEAWSRAGGYRSYENGAEDADLWTRITSQGWMVEFIGDNQTTVFYRIHSGSLSKTVGFPDWVSGREWKYRNSGLGYPVQIYDCPEISFILRYCIKEEDSFIKTVDSIEGLKATAWEICADGYPPQRIKDGWPFVRWNKAPTCPTQVFLEAGETIDDKEWDKIEKRAKWPT